TYAYDVFSGVTKNFHYTSERTEGQSARVIAPQMEKGSITLYDRCFFGHELVDTHIKHQSYFIMRIKKNVNLESKKWKGKVRFVVAKNPKTKESISFATNLPEQGYGKKSSCFSIQDDGKLKVHSEN